MFRCFVFLFVFFVSFNLFQNQVSAQGLPYGTVIGGVDSESFARSFLKQNEKGVRITVIVSSGMGMGMMGGAGGGGAMGGGQTQILEVPADTDYLELLMFYVGQDPRQLRRNKIKILRVVSSGEAPFKSGNIKREWLTYNFESEYKRGGPFTLVQPGDIIIINRKGLLNREAFDFLVDFRFLVTLPTLIVSTVLILNQIKQ